MECQVLLTEFFRLLHDGSPKHLLGAHALSPDLIPLNLCCKIWRHTIGEDRVLIEKAADSLQLLCPGVIHHGHGRRPLIPLILEHSTRSLFSLPDIALTPNQNPNNKTRNLSTWNALFYLTVRQLPISGWAVDPIKGAEFL